jgi:hypothetical protein
MVMRWSFVPLFPLIENIESVLHFYEPGSLPIIDLDLTGLCIF